MSNEVKNELDFEKMEARIKDNFQGNTNNAAAAEVNERLKEMNKKLPSWNLEPPHTFLK